MKIVSKWIVLALVALPGLTGSGCDTGSTLEVDINGVWREMGDAGAGSYMSIDGKYWTEYTLKETTECYDSNTFVLEPEVGETYLFEGSGKRARVTLTLQNNRLYISGEKDITLIRARVELENMTPLCEWPLFD